MTRLPRGKRWVGLAPLAVALAGCGAATPARPVPVMAVGPALGVSDPTVAIAPDDHVVRVVNGASTCSGTLVHPGVVLTAHHCVAERDASGRYLGADAPAERVLVEVGGGDLAWGEVGVRHVVAPGCGWGGGEGDIALLVLERRVPGLPVAPARLDGEPTAGERLEPRGFGRCAVTDDSPRRRLRQGGAVTGVYASRFHLRASVCPGDSGGPLMNAGGEVVGVISAAVMDGDARTAGPVEATRLDAWRPLFAAAVALAEGASPAELPPLDACR